MDIPSRNVKGQGHPGSPGYKRQAVGCVGTEAMSALLPSFQAPENE